MDLSAFSTQSESESKLTDWLRGQSRLTVLHWSVIALCLRPLVPLHVEGEVVRPGGQG